MAFAFGLLHGFGFAGAPGAVGLPRGDIPLALFGFNAGVELGQLAFVAGVVGVLQLARRRTPPAAAELALRTTSYAIGILAASWFLERFWAFLS